jgi:hypothetical protein
MCPGQATITIDNKGTAKLKTTGARCEIAVDGKPRSYRDNKEMASTSAKHLEVRNPKPWRRGATWCHP